MSCHECKKVVLKQAKEIYFKVEEEGERDEDLLLLGIVVTIELEFAGL